MQRSIFNFFLAIEQVSVNKLRSILTALGIIFGVGAVIAMLAIGSGARQSILDQMKLIGVNNIVIEGLLPDEMEEEEESSDNTTSNSNSNNNSSDKRPYSPGLTLADAEAITQIVPGIDFISPEVEKRTNLLYGEKQQSSRCIGVYNTYFELNNLQLSKGSFFSDVHLREARPVCIIGRNVEKKFFGGASAIGAYIKADRIWLKVIGVLESKSLNSDNLESLGLRDLNEDIYTPVSTILTRFNDRGKFVKNLIGRRRRRGNPNQNIHQLDRLVIRMKESNTLQASADLTARILYRKHNQVKDYEVKVPELLLEQEQKTQDTFNFVLAAIAGISLLVGGIGIMNIMLASVLERTKEIGIRRSLGATRKDIIQQFVFEAVFISLLGGIIGIMLGVVAAQIIAASADIPTIITAWSIILSFGVSSSVGLIFGIVPAQRAAELDPITALRT